MGRGLVFVLICFVLLLLLFVCVFLLCYILHFVVFGVGGTGMPISMISFGHKDTSENAFPRCNMSCYNGTIHVISALWCWCR